MIITEKRCDDSQIDCFFTRRICSQSHTIFYTFIYTLRDYYKFLDSFEMEEKNKKELISLIDFLIQQIEEFYSFNLLKYVSKTSLKSKMFTLFTSCYIAYLHHKISRETANNVFEYLYNYYLVAAKQGFISAMNFDDYDLEVNLAIIDNIMKEFGYVKIRPTIWISQNNEKNVEKKIKNWNLHVFTKNENLG